MWSHQIRSSNQVHHFIQAHMRHEPNCQQNWWKFYGNCQMLENLIAKHAWWSFLRKIFTKIRDKIFAIEFSTIFMTDFGDKIFVIVFSPKLVKSLIKENSDDNIFGWFWLSLFHQSWWECLRNEKKCFNQKMVIILLYLWIILNIVHQNWW